MSLKSIEEVGKEMVERGLMPSFEDIRKASHDYVIKSLNQNDINKLGELKYLLDMMQSSHDVPSTPYLESVIEKEITWLEGRINASEY